MEKNSVILSSVKSMVHEIAPGSKVLLFGSRANETSTEESDWDFLILVQQTLTRHLKESIQHKVFPLSIKLGSFINLLIAEENEWLNNPSYYTIHREISNGVVMA